MVKDSSCVGSVETSTDGTKQRKNLIQDGNMSNADASVHEGSLNGLLKYENGVTKMLWP